MQARGLLNYRLKYCWPKVIYCIYINQTNLNGKLRKNWGAKQGAKQKSVGAMTHPGPLLELPLWAHPSLQDRILLNYTRIENVHKVSKKLSIFCYVQKSSKLLVFLFPC